MSKPWGCRYHGTKLRRNLFTGGAASGMKGGLSLARRRLSGTWEPETPMRTEKPQVAEPQGREEGSGDSGSELRVGEEKSPTNGRRDGGESRSIIHRATQQWRVRDA